MGARYRLYSGFQNESGAGGLGWRVAVAGAPVTGSAGVVARGRYNVRLSVGNGGASGPVELLTPVADSWDFPSGGLGSLSGVAYVRVPDATLTVAANDDEPTIDVGLFAVALPDGPADAAITATSSSVTLARYDAAYTFTGGLTSGTAPLAGRIVTLQKATASTGPWGNTIVSATTAADGSFVLKHVPRSKTFYRARFAGDGDYGACTSDVRSAQPRASVGDPVAPAVMYKGKAATVRSTLKPRHTAGTYPVRIYKYRHVSGKWKSYGYAKAKASNYSS